MKKHIWLTLTIFLILLVSFDVEALKSSSSDLINRNVCETFEVALANPDDTITSVGCYSDYVKAKEAMDNHESDDTIILEKISGKFKVIDAKYALAYLDRGNVNTNVYTTSSLKTAYTYMNNYASWGGTEAAFLGLNYNNKAIQVKISGITGWIPNNTYTLIPLNWVKSSSYYYMNNTSIYHYYAKNIENSGYTQMGRALGPKIEGIEVDKRYYSYDGIYLYNDLKTMLGNYKANNYNNSVNNELPYYNYYMYLPHRSKTNYTVDDLDVYLRNVLNFKGSIYGKKNVSRYSVLYGQSDFYLNAEKKYGANALSVFSLSRNESSNGQSAIARDKNNIFGHGAIDGSAYNSASGYLDVRSSIYSHSYGYINYGYSEVSDSRYFGGHFGNKNMGMNVKYASDPYWGEKAVNFYYEFDKDNGFSDYNYYQLAITNNTNINVRTEPNTSSAKPYAYKYKNTPMIILEEVEGQSINGSTLWYKIQSDSNLNSTRTGVLGANSTWPEYNWNSYVYIHSSYANKINDAKNEDGTYNKPSDVKNDPIDNLTYKTYATTSEYTPIVVEATKNIDYYFTSSLINKKGTILQGAYLTVLEEAKNDSEVRYLVITDYSTYQKAWISGENVKIIKKDLVGYVSNTAGAKIDVYSQPNGTDLGDIYTNNYLTILDKEEADGDFWLKVQYKINPLAYGYIKVSEDLNYTLNHINHEPVIIANDKTFMFGDEYDLMEDISGYDEEDGDITSRIIIKENKIDDTKPGTYTVTYSLTDSYNVTVYKTINVYIREYQEGEPLFMYNSLIYKGDNTFEISGFLGVKGMDNKEVKHALYLYNHITEEYLYTDLENWQEYPYEMSSLDDKKVYDYSGGWFMSEIDFADVPSGDYMLIVAAENGEYETATAFTNISYGEMTRRVKDGEKGYAIEIDYTTAGTPLLFSVRDNGLISYDVPLTTDPMYNFFTTFKLENQTLTLRGTSHSVGVDFGINKKVNRQIIFENVETFERVIYELDSITDGDYPITLAVSDNCDKTKAWYHQSVVLEDLKKGTYAIYIKNTVDGKGYYGELIDIAYTDFSKVNNDKYTFKRADNRRLRVELTVNE